MQEVAWVAGISEGSVENYSNQCLTAIESLHDMFVCLLTPEEKEQEKRWVDEQLGFKGTWQEGWVMCMMAQLLCSIGVQACKERRTIHGKETMDSMSRYVVLYFKYTMANMYVRLEMHL